MAQAHRVGIVGTGNMGGTHTKAYQRIVRARVVAGADINRETLSKWSEQSGVTAVYASYLEMVEREKPDVVSVCVQANIGPGIVVELARTGIVQGILCEKPPAANMADATRMVEACEKAGVKLAINHQRRFLKWHRKTKELIDTGAVGKVAFMWASVTTKYPDPLVWMTHVTDMMRFYAGDVEWLMGQVADLTDESPHGGQHHYPDALVGYLAFKSGLRAIIECDQSLSQIRIAGDNGQIIAPMDAPLKVMTEDSPQWVTPSMEGYGADDSAEAFVAAAEDVFDAVEQDRQPRNNGREGIAALEVLLAVYESARTRDRVVFPLQQKEYPLSVMLRERPA